MATYQLDTVHYNETNDRIIVDTNTIVYGHSGNDHFMTDKSHSGEIIPAYLAGGQGDDFYETYMLKGTVFINENSGEGSDRLSINKEMFDLDSLNYVADLNVFSVDHQHLVLTSKSLDQKIIIANGMHDFGNIEEVRSNGAGTVKSIDSDSFFSLLFENDLYKGDFSARELGARDEIIQLDNVTYTSQLVSQIENNLADDGLTWDVAQDYMTNNLDNPQSIYIAAQLSDLNTEMVGVLVGVSTETVNDYFTGNGFDPAGLG